MSGWDAEMRTGWDTGVQQDGTLEWGRMAQWDKDRMAQRYRDRMGLWDGMLGRAEWCTETGTGWDAGMWKDGMVGWCRMGHWDTDGRMLGYSRVGWWDGAGWDTGIQQGRMLGCSRMGCWDGDRMAQQEHVAGSLGSPHFSSTNRLVLSLPPRFFLKFFLKCNQNCLKNAGNPRDMRRFQVRSPRSLPHTRAAGRGGLGGSTQSPLNPLQALVPSHPFANPDPSAGSLPAPIALIPFANPSPFSPYKP